MEKLSCRLMREAAEAKRRGSSIAAWRLTCAEVSELAGEFGPLIRDPAYAGRTSTFNGVPIELID